MAREPTKSAAVLFAEDLVRGVQLRRQFRARKKDLDFLKDSGRNRIIYALDASVLWSYFYPAVGDEDGHIETGMSFHGDPENKVVTERLRKYASELTSILASYIVDLATPGFPHILLDGHNQEALELYDKIVERFLGQKRQFQSVRIQFEAIAGKLPHDAPMKEKRRFLKANAQKIWSLLYQLKQPHSAYRRFNFLFQSQRMLSVDAATELDVFEHLKDASGHMFDPRDDRIGAEAKEFSDRLHRENIRRDHLDARPDRPIKVKQNRTLFNVDVVALTRLFEINRRLGKKHRLILVTRDERLLDLGRSVRVGDDGASLTDMYMRHPRAFLASPELLSPISEDQGDLSVSIDAPDRNPHPEGRLSADWLWLNTLLTSFDEQLDTDSIDDFDLAYDPIWFNDFRQRAHDTLADDPDAHSKFIAAWNTHLQQLVKAHTVTSDLALQQVRQIFDDRLESKADFMSGLRTVVDEETEASWAQFFETAARAGYDLVGDSPSTSKLTKRSLPIALFTHHESANSISGLLINGLELGKARRRLLDAIEALPQEDQSGYTRSLGYALLFAYADRWQIAELLARRAVESYKRNWRRDQEPDHRLSSNFRISGREAYFLSAGFARINATSLDHLDEVRDLLGEANEALTNEVTACRKSIGPLSEDELPTDIRFKAEAISVDVSELMLRVYSDDKKLLQSDILNKLTDRIFKECSRILTENLTKLPEGWLKERVELNTITNLFITLFAAEKAELGKPPQGVLELAKSLVPRHFELNGGGTTWMVSLRSQSSQSNQPAPSRPDRVACMYALARFGLPSANRSSFWLIRREAVALNFTLRISPHLINSTVYDAKRYADMISAIQIHIDKNMLTLND